LTRDTGVAKHHILTLRTADRRRLAIKMDGVVSASVRVTKCDDTHWKNPAYFDVFKTGWIRSITQCHRFSSFEVM
jgi:hypothetical protein